MLREIGGWLKSVALVLVLTCVTAGLLLFFVGLPGSHGYAAAVAANRTGAPLVYEYRWDNDPAWYARRLEPGQGRAFTSALDRRGKAPGLRVRLAGAVGEGSPLGGRNVRDRDEAFAAGRHYDVAVGGSAGAGLVARE